VDAGFRCSRLGQSAVNIVGWMTLLTGAMILTGEYLCVEVAWRCMDYNTGLVGFTIMLLISGLIMIMIGTKDD
jgi:hypothetical protein